MAYRIDEHLLVPQEKDFVRAGLACAPVAEKVVPYRAIGGLPLAGRVEQISKRERTNTFEKMPQGNKHILGVPADEDDFAVGVISNGGGQQGVMHVRVHEPRRRQRLKPGVLPGGEQLVHEGDTLVRVHAEERVLRVGGRVRAPRHGGERQRLEPGRAALGRAREEDVAGAWREASLESDEPGDSFLDHPGATVLAQHHA